MHLRIRLIPGFSLPSARLLLPALLPLMAVHPLRARPVDAISGFDGSPAAAARLPKALSATGLYVNTASKAKAVTPGIEPFEVNNPLWSDGAAKQRWISLPPGTKIAPTDTDHYRFPDQSILIKNFAIDTVAGDSASRIVIETRFLVYRAAGPGDGVWHGISYQWNAEQTEGVLVSQTEGADRVIRVRLGNLWKGKPWHYPSQDQCAACHTMRGTLGFITPQLNRPSASHPGLNQLQELMDKGILASNPIAGKANPFRWVGMTESGATLEAKARSYFASNCSQCHGNGNFPGPQHDFDYFNPARKIDTSAPGGYVHRAPIFRNPRFSQLIYPGYPESSLVIMRMLSRGTLEDLNPDQMPPLGTYQPDSVAARVIRDWICSIGSPPRTASACRLPVIQTPDSYWSTGVRGPEGGRGRSLRKSTQALQGLRLRLVGRVLSVSTGAEAGGKGNGERLGKVVLYDRLGREVPMVLVGAGTGMESAEYRVGAELVPGVYLVRVGRAKAEVGFLP